MDGLYPNTRQTPDNLSSQSDSVIQCSEGLLVTLMASNARTELLYLIYRDMSCDLLL
ncbi:hypothetical protein SK128_004029, partial [Halocaridina rubra]